MNSRPRVRRRSSARLGALAAGAATPLNLDAAPQTEPAVKPKIRRYKPFGRTGWKVGDEIIYTTEAGRFVYVITGTFIVAPEEMWVIEQTPEFVTTLFACHPLHSTSHRMVVFLKLRP